MTQEATAPPVEVGKVKSSESPTLRQFIPAMIAARKKFTPVVKNATAQINANRKYEYATLSQVLASIEDGLGENGLMVSSKPSQDGPKLRITTKVRHTSGEWMKISLACRCPDESPQTIGSAITYLRRYLILLLFNLAPEEDDDGASAQRPAQRQQTDDSGQGRAARRVVRPPARPVETPPAEEHHAPPEVVDAEYEQNKKYLRNALLEICGQPGRGETWTAERIQQRNADMDRCVFYATGATQNRVESAKVASQPENVQHVLAGIQGILAAQADPHDYARFLQDARDFAGV